MTTWNTLQLDRQTATPLKVTSDQKENKKMPTLRRFFVFCQRTASQFASRAFLAVKKDTAKSRTAFGKLAKSLALPPATIRNYPFEKVPL